MQSRSSGRPFGVYFLFVASCAGVLQSRAVSGDTTAAETGSGSQFLVLPALAYSPETRFLGGVVAGYFWHTPGSLKKSSLSGDILYSQNEQVQAGISFQVFSDSGRGRLTGEVGYSYWPGKFFGIGNRTPAAAEEPFTEKFFRSTLSWLIGAGSGLSVGPECEFRVSTDVQTSEGGALRSGRISGTEGYVASGIGIAGLLDTRDDNFSPQTGRLVYLSGRWFAGALGSDFTFARYTIDAREYVPIAADHVVGLQAYLCAIAGSAPYQMLPLLGGEFLGRGYYSGRYRDNILLSAQAEYRTPFLYRFGLVLFGGATQVANRFPGLALREIHPFAGFGIRFRLLSDVRVNLRVDWGYGDNSAGNYIDVNEAF